MTQKLTRIYSQRKTSPYPSYQTLYEWEDILAERLGLHIDYVTKLDGIIHRRFEKNNVVELYHFLKRKEEQEIGLKFVMMARTKKFCANHCNSIPIIIDFWLEEKELGAFYEAYKHVPLMLVTNLEVYEYLNNYHFPIPIEHWPLSLPDKYALTWKENFKKTYDFCIIGRPNPFFIRLLDEYSEKHPDFVYVKNNGDINNRQYVTNKGVYVGGDNGKDSYIKMIRCTKVSCYTTPGLDESKNETSRYNQVTPRVFEMLTNGCHVIGHYPTNGSDVKYYNLNSIIPNVENYMDFEKELDRMLSTPFDIIKAKSFLSKHYTSVRAEMLRDILRNHDIIV